MVCLKDVSGITEASLRESAMRRSAGKIGLALGGGGARGWAHIGVINALGEAGVKADFIAGTSMGALVGAACASGRIDALHQVALDLDWRRIAYYLMEFTLPRMGLIDGARIMEFVNEHVDNVDIRELQVPYAAVAADIMTGKEVVVREGSVTDAVRASIAIPGMFTPFVRDDHVLVDGGLVNPLPVNVARDLGAEFVIAVDITRAPLTGKRHKTPQPASDEERGQTAPELLRNDMTKSMLDKLNLRLRSSDLKALSLAEKWFGKSELPNIFEIYGNTMRIFQRQITSMRLRLESPDILIQPEIQDISTMEFHRAGEAINAGYEAARHALENHFPGDAG